MFTPLLWQRGGSLPWVRRGRGGSGTEGQTYMCEYRLILNMADPTGFFKIGLFCSDKYYYVIHSFDLLLFWFIELREYY